ncbi:MAG: glycosyltransferase family 2 protein [Acidobacteria bacterium]|nr:glycosyltransferase family 2 protein [Acidobacteriota bacterium]
MSRVDITVVVPTYRAGGSLELLVPRVIETIQSTGNTLEIILVDDRSPDDTWDRIGKLAADYPLVQGVRLQRNIGQMAATLCGLAQSHGDVVITMDDDLQHPPEELPKLIGALKDNPDWDVVIGSWDRGRDGWFRAIGSRIFAWLQDMAVPEGSGLRHTSFRAMRRGVVDALLEHGTRNPVMLSLPFEVAESIHNVPVAHSAREIGESNFNFRKSVKLTVDNFIQSSTLPLRFVAWFGLVTAFVSAIIGAVYLVRVFLGPDTPPGWASTFLPIVFFGGATLMSVGLLGRYIEVVMSEVRRPPRWVIRETTDD